MRNPTATDFGSESEKFLFRSVWTLAARGGARVKLNEAKHQTAVPAYQLDITFNERFKCSVFSGSVQGRIVVPELSYETSLEDFAGFAKNSEFVMPDLIRHPE